jgi:hypothetical protein
MIGIKKKNLPHKICTNIGKPFIRRKKWQKVWDEVKYCSEKCRGWLLNCVYIAVSSNV